MKNLKLHTPTGLTDLLPQAYQLKRSVERRVETVFESFGYDFISSSVLEYLAVFEGKGSIPVTQMYKLVDRTGDMLALRPDMTPAVARIALTHKLSNFSNFSDLTGSSNLSNLSSSAPLRLCYIEKAFRDHERFQGRENEFTQAGAELIGVSSPEADAELIALAVQGLIGTGLNNFRIDIGQVDFLPGVLAELGSALSAAECQAFIGHMIRRDYVAAETLAIKAKHIVPAGAFLADLTLLTGGADILARAKSMLKNPQAMSALRHLEEVYAILQDQGLAQYVLIDLSMTGQLDYYTGVIFKGYAKGSGSTVVDGGRYDKLLIQFSDNPINSNFSSNDSLIPAVGFGIKIDGILDALEAQVSPFEWECCETLLAYHNSARAVALTTGDIMRRQGLRIENSLINGELKEQKEYAKIKNFKGLIYFANPDTVLLVNMESGQEDKVSVEELMKTTC